MPDLSLASDFPAATPEAWRALVDKVLKGADFDKKLVARTHDGLRVEPLYQRASSAVPVRRAEGGAWRIAQRVDHPDPATANALALADLEGGADALTIVGPSSPGARGFGVSITPDALERTLAAIRPDLIAIRLDAGLDAVALARILRDRAASLGLPAASLELDVGLDPIGLAAATGSVPAQGEGLAATLHAALETLGGAHGRLLLCDGRPYHEAGGSDAQELAAVLATGVAYLRALETSGMALDQARDSLSFLLVADADQFGTIAKLRALRRLWVEVEAACGLAAKPLRLYAETAWRMTTARDPWVNLLRGTIAAAAAGLGGADSVGVLPFTAALGLPDAFARRLARNTQLILLEEANLSRVADPVAGSGAFESLTDALVGKAWSLFQEIEREGGIAGSLASGAIQARIAAVAVGRSRAVATRREPITGTSEFPNIDEAAVAVLAERCRPSVAPAPGALLASRSAEPFEALRDRADAAGQVGGRRPGVFLANLGPLSAFSARATFARNAFAAGGLAALPDDGFASTAHLIDAFRASGLTLACLCSSDEIYGTEAAIVARTLREAGAAGIYLAGRPGDREEDFKAAGIDRFLYVGCDLVALLDEALNEFRTTGTSAEGTS